MFNINNLARRATISLTGGKDDDNESYKHNNLARRASLSNNQHKRAIERANLTRTPNTTTNNYDNNDRRRVGNKIIRNVNNMRSSFSSTKSTAQSTQTSTSFYNNGYDLPSYSDTYTNNQQQEQNNNKEESCDPLMYRLQHQQLIKQEKHDRRKLRRSISDGGGVENKERDPFDLWGTSSDEGTSTSDNKGSGKDKGQDVADDLIHDIIHGHNKNSQPEVVDVAGWGGSDDDEYEENIGTPDCSGWEGSRSTTNVKQKEEEEDEEGICIDYGSVKTEERKRLPQYLFTPPEMGGGLERVRRRGQSSGQQHDVEEEEYEDCENDDDNSTYTHTGLFVDFGGIVPQQDDDIPTPTGHKSNRRRSQCTSDAQIHNNSHRRRKRSNSITSRGSYKSLHSDLSSVTNFTNWPNDDDEDENDYLFDNYEEDKGYETSQGGTTSGSIKNRRASLAELEDILSNLEKEALTPTSSLFDSETKQQQAKTAAVIDKSLQIPSMLSPGCGQESQQKNKILQDESQQKKVSPTPSVKSIATTTTRRLTLSKEEENDPRLFQLNQSSIEELQIELSNMQSQSKSNLELSWGDTERMRCEVTELDDKITEIKKKLDDANNKLVSSSSRSSSFYRPKHTTRHFVETNFGTTSKSVCPPRVKLRRRRRRTIEGGSMRFSQTVAGSFVANADSLLGLIEGGEESNDTIDKLPKSIIDLANIRPQLNRRSISSRSCGDKSQEEEELLGDSLDDSNEVKSFCTAPAKSSFKADKYSAEALRALLDADDNDDGMLVGDINQSTSSIISSDLGIDLDIHSHAAMLSTDGISVLMTTSSSTNSKPEIDDKIFKSLLSFPTPDATDDEGQSGVFYPAPNDEDDEDSSSDSSVQSGVIFSTLDDNDNDSGHYPTSRHESVAMASLVMDAMEDFDFDPLKSLTDVDNNDCKSVKSFKSTKSTKSGKFLRRPSMNRRPSIMGFFDSNDDSMASSTTPPQSSSFPPDGNSLVKQGKNRSIERIKSRIEEKDEELVRMTKSVQEQEDKIQTCELNFDEANINCSQKEGHLKDEESTAQQEVKALMQKDGDSEAKLEDLEDTEKDVVLRERELIKQLSNMPEVCLDRDDEIELETQLSLWQQKYDDIQEKAIGSLSSLLNEFDTLGIPNLQEDIESSKRGEDTVSADIIARYDIFLDKESELVRVLSEQGRLSTFEAIRSESERSVHVGKQLSKLQADLAVHSLTLVSMIAGDDQGTDVTSSSTASERLSMEKEFIDVVISHLNSANKSQEELILETLPKIVQHLKYWEKILLPGFALSSNDADHSTNVIESLPIIDGLVKSVEEVLVQTKSSILDEHNKYMTAMERADLTPSCHHSTLEAKSKVLS